MTLEHIAQKVGVHVNTVSRWKKKDSWEDLRKGLQMTRFSQLQRLYSQYEQLNDMIMDRKKGKQFPSKAESDTQAAIMNQIDKLQKDLQISTIVDVFSNFINWLGKTDIELAKTIIEVQDAFIKSKAK